jgi:hypothetical protein
MLAHLLLHNVQVKATTAVYHNHAYLVIFKAVIVALILIHAKNIVNSLVRNVHKNIDAILAFKVMF